MLVTKLVMATSACIIHWLAPGTSCPTPTALTKLGVWSSEKPCHPGVALVGNDSLPALIVSPAGFSPPDTLGVQPVAVCAELFGCDGGTLSGGGGAGPLERFAFGYLSPLLRPITKITASAMTPRTATPARINHGAFERGPPGGGPGGGHGPPGKPGGTCCPGWGNCWGG